MEINVRYKDGNSNCTDKVENIAKLELIKHMAIAGQDNLPCISKLKRIIGLYLLYENYFDFNGNNFFKDTEGEQYDPTEKGQFSVWVGRGIANYLARAISGANITFN